MINLNILILIVAIALPSINNYLNFKTYISILIIVFIISALLTCQTINIPQWDRVINIFYDLIFIVFLVIGNIYNYKIISINKNSKTSYFFSSQYLTYFLKINFVFILCLYLVYFIFDFSDNY
jgi:hypothetical protein